MHRSPALPLLKSSSSLLYYTLTEGLCIHACFVKDSRPSILHSPRSSTFLSLQHPSSCVALISDKLHSSIPFYLFFVWLPHRFFATQVVVTFHLYPYRIHWMQDNIKNKAILFSILNLINFKYYLFHVGLFT